MTIPGVLRGMTVAHHAVRAGSFIGCRNVVDLTEDAKPAHGQNGSYTGWMYNKKAVAVVETAAEPFFLNYWCASTLKARPRTF